MLKSRQLWAPPWWRLQKLVPRKTFYITKSLPGKTFESVKHVCGNATDVHWVLLVRCKLDESAESRQIFVVVNPRGSWLQSTTQERGELLYCIRHWCILYTNFQKLQKIFSENSTFKTVWIVCLSRFKRNWQYMSISPGILSYFK